MARNHYDFTNQRAIVTGGAQGIGRAIVDRLVAGSAQVAIWDTDASLAESVASEYPEGQVVPIQVNVADLDSVNSAWDSTKGKLGGAEVLVNSAGIAGDTATVENYDLALWKKTLDINLTGTFYVCRAVITGMRQQNYGRIVNIASIAGKEGNPNASAYSASKAGVIALTKSLAKETADLNISVNCITPAAARTRIFEQISEEHIQYMLSKIPRGRFVQVEEIAAMVCWIASEENSFTTGAAFDLSGGRATY